MLNKWILIQLVNQLIPTVVEGIVVYVMKKHER